MRESCREASRRKQAGGSRSSRSKQQAGSNSCIAPFVPVRALFQKRPALANEDDVTGRKSASHPWRFQTVDEIPDSVEVFKWQDEISSSERLPSGMLWMDTAYFNLTHVHASVDRCTSDRKLAGFLSSVVSNWPRRSAPRPSAQQPCVLHNRSR